MRIWQYIHSHPKYEILQTASRALAMETLIRAPQTHASALVQMLSKHTQRTKVSRAHNAFQHHPPINNKQACIGSNEKQTVQCMHNPTN
jgi:hypothetical protein